jgi:formylglycine-generating enzyme required for sulfatase activity
MKNRSTRRKVLPAVTIAACIAAACRASLEAGEFVPLALSQLHPGNDCRAVFAAEGAVELRIANLGRHRALIASPRQDQDYGRWLQALTAYRESVRTGGDPDHFVLDFRGVRCWLRVDGPLAKRLAFRSGERLGWQFEAQSVRGNNTLCLAFDIHGADDAKTDWSTVLSAVQVPQDGAWHRVTAELAVPEFDAATSWLRPIFGMDATHDPTPGTMLIRRVALRSPGNERAEAIRTAPRSRGLDLSLYDRPDLAWLATSFACHFTFMYDRSFYDPERGAFTVDRFLEEGRREFGGYDALLLWHAYPRIGIDERNQFDFYRDMPGGLEGMRNLVHAIQHHGVRVYINYNPWDRATRREPVSTMQALADTVAAMDVDGIFLDTLAAGSQELRRLVDERRRGVVFVPELFPSVTDLPSLMGSWYQFGENPFPEPGLLHHKWIEPRHMHFQISRWKGLDPAHRDPHYQEIENAYFNGSGMMIWENIFGTHNPWRAEERMLWSRAVRILRAYADHFAAGAWQPFYPTEREGLYSHRWSKDGRTVFTLVNEAEPFEDAPLLTISAPEAKPKAFDVWRGKELLLSDRGDGRYRIQGSVERLGGVVVAPQVDARLSALLAAQQHDAWRRRPEVDTRNAADSVVYAKPVTRTVPAPAGEAPDGMVYVPGAMLRLRIKHMQREHGCYPDPGIPPEDRLDFFKGYRRGTLRHDIGPVQVHPFFIDTTEVSNAQFKAFLDATGYRPRHPANFLKHWPGGTMPRHLADHPVVYVDLDDARAYARWADKRLPAEEEWHLAAQGTDGRTWPWGTDEVSAERVNLTGDRTLPVRSCPDGRSPYGCYHMSGNVYEWTESCRSDRHTRFVMIRGGSYYDPKADPKTASYWYTDGGPRPCEHHAKFILMYPGLDRCATIGFRCVKDAAAERTPAAKQGASRAAIEPIRAPFDMPQLKRPVFPDRTVDIRDHGAVGNGTTINTRAIRKAIAACAKAGGGRVLVPAGVWLTGAVHLRSNIELHLAAEAVLRFSTDPKEYLPVVFTRWAGFECYNYSPLIYARDCRNIAVTGPGQIDGQGRAWWPWAKRQSTTAHAMYQNQVLKGIPPEKRVYGTPEAALRPQLISPINCRNVLLEGFTIAEPGPFWTIHAVYCENVIMRRLSIRTAGGPNTDGLNTDSCRNVLIEHCAFDTGDDCIAMKSGINEDGWRVGRPTENVVIRHIRTRRGHGGVVFGSETSGGIRNVYIHDCAFNGTDVGIRLKSTRGRGGVVESIHIENVTMERIRTEAIRINTHYRAWFSSNGGKAPTFRTIGIRNVTCTGARAAAHIVGLPEQPIENLTLEDVSLEAETGLRCEYVDGLNLIRANVKPRSGPPVQTENCRNVRYGSK